MNEGSDQGRTVNSDSVAQVIDNERRLLDRAVRRSPEELKRLLDTPDIPGTEAEQDDAA